MLPGENMYIAYHEARAINGIRKGKERKYVYQLGVSERQHSAWKLGSLVPSEAVSRSEPSVSVNK